MGFDVGLMDGCGFEAVLDDDVGLFEAGVHVAQNELNFLGDVRGFGWRGCDALRDHVVEQDGCVRLHGVVDVDDEGEDFVVDLDQLERATGDPLLMWRRRRRGGGLRTALFRAP